MNETEFKLALHGKLCDLADLFLYHYNPCHIRGGACLAGDPNPCCVRTRFRRFDREDKRCQFITECGCSFPNIECKVWLCQVATEQADPDCLKALHSLDEIARIYRLTNER